MVTKKLMCALLIGLAPAAAFGGSFSAMVSGAPGSTVTLNVAFAGDGETDNADTRLDFSNLLTFSNPVGASPGDTCQIVSATRIRVVPRDGTGTPLPNAATTYCSFTVAISAAAPEALLPLTVNTISCTNINGNPAAACTLAAMSGVTVANQPIPRTLSYNPAVGSTITFAAGATPNTAAPAQNIVVTATGTAGLATLSGCAITGTGAASFSVAPTSLTFAASGPQNLVVGCTYPTANAAATLTCTETDGDTVAPGAARAFQLSCPAPAVNPTITSNPASPATITLPGGSAGSQSVGLIDLSATGGSGTGSRAISCTSTGSVQISAFPATPSGQGPVAQTVTGNAPPTDIRVGALLTANAQASAGVVTCTVAGQANLVFTIAAPAGTTTIPPTFIPSSSTWSALALLSLLGVFGLLAVAFRRQA